MVVMIPMKLGNGRQESQQTAYLIFVVVVFLFLIVVIIKSVALDDGGKVDLGGLLGYVLDEREGRLQHLLTVVRDLHHLWKQSGSVKHLHKLS